MRWQGILTGIDFKVGDLTDLFSSVMYVPNVKTKYDAEINVQGKVFVASCVSAGTLDGRFVAQQLYSDPDLIAMYDQSLDLSFVSRNILQESSHFNVGLKVERRYSRQFGTLIEFGTIDPSYSNDLLLQIAERLPDRPT